MSSKYIKNLEYSTYILDERLCVVKCDDAFYKITGYTKEDVEAGRVNQEILIVEEDRKEYFDMIGPTLAKNGELYVEHRLRRKDGSSIFVFCLGHMLPKEDGKVYSKIRITDTTTMTSLRLQAEAIRHENDKKVEHLKEIASTDDLTGLYRRGAFVDEIKRRMFLHPNNAIMILDVDDFKNVNDAYGHSVGDDVLVQIAGVFKSVMRDTDVVCRLGGDEFTIFIAGVDSKEILSDIAGRLIREVEKISVAADKEMDVHISVGMHIFSTADVADDFSDIYNAADRALYKAKSNGKNQYAFSDDSE